MSLCGECEHWIEPQLGVEQPPCPNDACIRNAFSLEIWKATDELDDLVAMFSGITDGLQPDEDGYDFCGAIWAFERRLQALVKRIEEGNKKP